MCICSFQVHGAHHAPDPAGVIADGLVLQMKNEVAGVGGTLGSET